MPKKKVREFKRLSTVWRVTEGQKSATVRLLITPCRPFGENTELIDFDPTDNQFRRVVKAIGYKTSRKDFFERDDLGGTSFDLYFSAGGLDAHEIGEHTAMMRMECISHKVVNGKVVAV